MAETFSRRSVLGASAAFLGCALAPPLHAAMLSPRSLRTASGREVQLWEWQAKGKAKGTILFSHGAASSPRHYERLFHPWASAGYDVLAPLHVDSTEHPKTAEFTGLSSWVARIDDLRLLSASLGDKPYIAAGHSYGGLTAIAMGGGVGVVPEGIKGALRDPRAVGVLALSPPPALAPLVGPAGYAPLAVPSFHQSGTKDVLPGSTNAEDWMGHLAAFHAANADAHHYALVLKDVDHYFGGLICRPDANGPPMETALNQCTALSAQFMDAVTSRSHRSMRRLQNQSVKTGPIGLFHK